MIIRENTCEEACFVCIYVDSGGLNIKQEENITCFPPVLFTIDGILISVLTNFQNHRTIHFRLERQDYKAFFVPHRSSLAGHINSNQFLPVLRVYSGSCQI